MTETRELDPKEPASTQFEHVKKDDLLDKVRSVMNLHNLSMVGIRGATMRISSKEERDTIVERIYRTGSEQSKPTFQCTQFQLEQSEIHKTSLQYANLMDSAANQLPTFLQKDRSQQTSVIILYHPKMIYTTDSISPFETVRTMKDLESIPFDYHRANMRVKMDHQGKAVLKVFFVSA